MVVGVLQCEIRVHDAESLKDKRRIIRSLKAKLHREHQVSVAEVAAHEILTRAVVAFALVAADGHRVAEVLDAIELKLRALRDGEATAITRQILHGSQISGDESEADAADVDQEMLRHAIGQEPGNTEPGYTKPGNTQPSNMERWGG